MQDENELSAEEQALARDLSDLLPGAPEISEQMLWYEAGVRAGRRRAARWRGAAAAVIVLAGGILMWRPKPATVYVRQEVPEQVVDVRAGERDRDKKPASMEYVLLRDAVEQHGMEALPRAGGGGVLSQPTQGTWPSRSVPSVPSPWDSLNTQGSL